MEKANDKARLLDRALRMTGAELRDATDASIPGEYQATRDRILARARSQAVESRRAWFRVPDWTYQYVTATLMAMLCVVAYRVVTMDSPSQPLVSKKPLTVARVVPDVPSAQPRLPVAESSGEEQLLSYTEFREQTIEAFDEELAPLEEVPAIIVDVEPLVFAFSDVPGADATEDLTTLPEDTEYDEDELYGIFAAIEEV